jgi:hypothetical protein
MHLSDFLILAVLDFIAKVIIAYAWPLVVLVVILVALWIFRETIRNSVENLLGRIMSVNVKWKGLELEIRFGQPGLPPPLVRNPTIVPLTGTLRTTGGRLVLKNVFDTVSLGGSASTSATLA